MSLIWWDCYLAELRPGLFSRGRVKPGSFYIFPQGLMWICFPSTWLHLHCSSEIFPKKYRYIFSVVKFGFKTHFIGAWWYFLCHSNPSGPFFLSAESKFIRVSFDWSWRKHQVYVTIKLPPRSKPNRGITFIAWKIIWFDDWAGFTKIIIFQKKYIRKCVMSGMYFVINVPQV